MKKIPHTFRRKSGLYYFRLALIYSYEGRKEIRISLKTREYSIAKVLAFRLWLKSQHLISNSPNTEKSELKRTLTEEVKQGHENPKGYFMNKENKDYKYDKTLSALDSVHSYLDLEKFHNSIHYLLSRDNPIYLRLPPHDAIRYPTEVQSLENGTRSIKRCYGSKGTIRYESGACYAVITSLKQISLEPNSSQIIVVQYYEHDADLPTSCSESFIVEPEKQLCLSIYQTYVDEKGLALLKGNSSVTHNDNVVSSDRNQLLSKGLELYMDEIGHNRAKSQEETKAIIEVFIEIVGDKSALDITYEKDIVKYRQTINKMPPNARKGKYKGLSITEVVERNSKLENPTFVSARTKEKYGSRVSSFFNFLEKIGWVNKNVARAIFKAPKQSLSDGRTPFSPAQIQNLFMSDRAKQLFLTPQSLKRPSRIWGLLLIAYTGARKEEIFSLETKDFVFDELNNLNTITFNEVGEKKFLKNSNAQRVIPLHDDLIEYGLKEYINKVKKLYGNRDGKLFPELNYSQKHGWGKAPAEWFNNTLLTRLGLKKNKLCLHCLRHTVIDIFKNSDNIKDPLHRMTYVGHSRGESESDRTYGNDVRPENLKYLLDSIDFELDKKAIIELTSNVKLRVKRKATN